MLLKHLFETPICPDVLKRQAFRFQHNKCLPRPCCGPTPSLRELHKYVPMPATSAGWWLLMKGMCVLWQLACVAI